MNDLFRNTVNYCYFNKIILTVSTSKNRRYKTVENLEYIKSYFMTRIYRDKEKGKVEKGKKKELR